MKITSEPLSLKSKRKEFDEGEREEAPTKFSHVSLDNQPTLEELLFGDTPEKQPTVEELLFGDDTETFVVEEREVPEQVEVSQPRPATTTIIPNSDQPFNIERLTSILDRLRQLEGKAQTSLNFEISNALADIDYYSPEFASELPFQSLGRKTKFKDVGQYLETNHSDTLNPDIYDYFIFLLKSAQPIQEVPNADDSIIKLLNCNPKLMSFLKGYIVPLKGHKERAINPDDLFKIILLLFKNKYYNLVLEITREARIHLYAFPQYIPPFKVTLKPVDFMKFFGLAPEFAFYSMWQLNSLVRHDLYNYCIRIRELNDTPIINQLLLTLDTKVIKVIEDFYQEMLAPKATRQKQSNLELIQQALLVKNAVKMATPVVAPPPVKMQAQIQVAKSTPVAAPAPVKMQAQAPISAQPLVASPTSLLFTQAPPAKVSQPVPVKPSYLTTKEKNSWYSVSDMRSLEEELCKQNPNFKTIGNRINDIVEAKLTSEDLLTYKDSVLIYTLLTSQEPTSKKEDIWYLLNNIDTFMNAIIKLYPDHLPKSARAHCIIGDNHFVGFDVSFDNTQKKVTITYLNTLRGRYSAYNTGIVEQLFNQVSEAFTKHGFTVEQNILINNYQTDNYNCGPLIAEFLAVEDNNTFDQMISDACKNSEQIREKHKRLLLASDRFKPEETSVFFESYEQQKKNQTTVVINQTSTSFTK